MKKVIVLGAGNIGKYIAKNLSSDNSVTIADYHQNVLDNINNTKISKIQADLSLKENIISIVKDYNFVVSALPEAFGYMALEAVLEAKKSVIDISFWEQDKENIQKLKEIAEKNNVTAWIDCGIAPGFSNAAAAYFDQKLLQQTRNINIYVGGVPQNRSRGFFAPWSIAGLIEEYKRKALCVINGIPVKVPAMSETKFLEFNQAGTLEAAITDGLRSISFNLDHVNNMGEYTLRYPGHFDQMKILAELGFFEEKLLQIKEDYLSVKDISEYFLFKADNKNPKYESVLDETGFFDEGKIYPVHNEKIYPIQIASDVLKEIWQMKPEDRDILVMRIQADDGNTEHLMDIFAEHNGDDSAMALTTGGMASISARAILNGVFTKSGVFPLEKVIQMDMELMDYFIDELEKIEISITSKSIKLT